MKISVLLFGVLRDVCSGSAMQVELGEGACVRDLVRIVQGDREGGVWEVIAVAVNREYARLETMLQEGDEVALLPPVSGGSEQTNPPRKTYCEQAGLLQS